MSEQKNITTFEELVFQPKLSHPMGAMFGFYGVGTQARVEFDNGYGASVISGQGAYGGDEGLYELAVLKSGSLCYDTPITSDVVGHLTPEDVTRLLGEIATLPAAVTTEAVAQ